MEIIDRQPLRANYICRPYRSLSVQDAPGVDEGYVYAYLFGRKVYRRTEYMVLSAGEERALVRLSQSGDGSQLFQPVSDVEYLAGPESIVFIKNEAIDTGNATQMARAAAEADVDVPVYVVEGRFQHVNFIYKPAPVLVNVVEVVPPSPPKLLRMAEQVLEFDEDLPPMRLRFVPIDLHDLVAGATAEHFLFPCRCAGLDLPGSVDFLDVGPTLRNWTLVGCDRSNEIHRFLYEREPDDWIQMCPRKHAADVAGLTLFKCCLRERGIEERSSTSDGLQVHVPWGASLEEVRQALHILARAAVDTEVVT